jgi:hypothetical protein
MKVWQNVIPRFIVVWLRHSSQSQSDCATCPYSLCQPYHRRYHENSSSYPIHEWVSKFYGNCLSFPIYIVGNHVWILFHYVQQLLCSYHNLKINLWRRRESNPRLAHIDQRRYIHSLCFYLIVIWNIDNPLHYEKLLFTMPAFQRYSITLICNAHSNPKGLWY